MVAATGERHDYIYGVHLPTPQMLQVWYKLEEDDHASAAAAHERCADVDSVRDVDLQMHH